MTDNEIHAQKHIDHIITGLSIARTITGCWVSAEHDVLTISFDDDPTLEQCKALQAAGWSRYDGDDTRWEMFV